MVDEEARSATLLMIQDYWDSCKLCLTNTLSAYRSYHTIERITFHGLCTQHVLTPFPTGGIIVIHWCSLPSSQKRIRKTCIDVV